MPILDLDGDGIGELVGFTDGDGAGDGDGDGPPTSDRPGLAIFSGVEAYGVEAGEVVVLSEPRWRLPGKLYFEYALVDANDLDQDGLPELTIASRPVSEPETAWRYHIVAGETLNALETGAEIIPATMSRWLLEPPPRTDDIPPYRESFWNHDVQGLPPMEVLPASARDVDGDGIGDLVLSLGVPDSPMVYVLLGRTVAAQPAGTTVGTGQSRWMFVAEGSTPVGEEHGGSLVVSAAADLDGDDLPEVFVRRGARTFVFRGSHLASVGEGAVVGTSEAEWILACHGSHSFACVTTSAVPVGDVDADGVVDLAFADQWTLTAESYGDVYVASGSRILGAPTGAELPLATLGPRLLSTEVEFHGSQLAVPGDLQGDGHADLWIQAASSDAAGGAPTERMFLVSGASLGTLEPGPVSIESIAHFTLRGGAGVRFGRTPVTRWTDSAGETGLLVSKSYFAAEAPSDAPGVWGVLLLDNPF